MKFLGTNTDSMNQKKLNQIERRNSVLDGLAQIAQGNTHNFDAVCDRLEKKYQNAIVHN